MRSPSCALLLALASVLLSAAPASAAEYAGTSAVDAAGDVREDVDGVPLPDVRTVETSYDDAAGRITVRFRFWEPIVVPTAPGELGGIPFYVEQFSGGATLAAGTGGLAGWDCPAGGTLRLSFTYRGFWGGGFPPSWEIAGEVGGTGYETRPATAELTPEELVITHEDPALAGRGYACVDDPALDQDTAQPFDFAGFPPTGALSLAQPLALDASTYELGETITGTVGWAGAGGITAVRDAVITARRPGATNEDGPWDDFAPRAPTQLVANGAALQLTASLTLPADAPTGTWQVFATWQDTLGVWHDGPAQTVAVTEATPAPEPTPEPSPAPPLDVPPAPAPPPPGPPPAQGGTLGGTRDALAPTVSTLVRSSRMATLRRGRFAITVLTSERSRIVLRLLHGGTVIARGTAATSGAGRRTVRLALTRAGRRKLRRLRRATFALRGSVTDAAGNERQIVRRVTLR